MIGILVFLVGVFAFIYKLSKKVENRKILMSLALVSILAFLVMTRMHERYLYPFFPYATILLASYPALMVPYIVLSITHLLNLYHLFWIPPLSTLEAFYELPQFTQAISLLNIFTFVYILRLFRSSKI